MFINNVLRFDPYDSGAVLEGIFDAYADSAGPIRLRITANNLNYISFCII